MSQEEIINQLQRLSQSLPDSELRLAKMLDILVSAVHDGEEQMLYADMASFASDRYSQHRRFQEDNIIAQINSILEV